MKQQNSFCKKQQRKRGKIADKKYARLQSFKRKRKLATIAIDRQIKVIEKKHLKHLIQNARKQQMHKLLNIDKDIVNKETLSKPEQVFIHDVKPTDIDLSERNSKKLQVEIFCFFLKVKVFHHVTIRILELLEL